MIHTFPYILRFRKAKKEKARSGEKKVVAANNNKTD
jgi:hypothetical protein